MRGSEAEISVVLALVLAASPSFGLAEGNLRTRAAGIFQPLPAAMTSTANPLTPEKVSLGKALFYEMRISSDGLVSCWRCHPLSLYGADGLKTAIGNNCRVAPRNSPTIFNAAGQISEHWVGNRRDVEDQAAQSVTGAGTFGMPSAEAVEKTLAAIPGYVSLFRKAFPGDAGPVTIANFARAVGAFERTLVTPSPFDAYLKGDAAALNEPAQQGLAAFMELGCAGCHAGAYVGGALYQKFGVVEPYWKYTRSGPVDAGRYDVTKQESDRYVFKVPPLRNVDMTPPYFHDGSVSRLEEAIPIMARVQLGKELDEAAIRALQAFLRSLTGAIPEEALKVPVLPPTE
jgi:cytochrome c peroxidase